MDGCLHVLSVKKGSEYWDASSEILFLLSLEALFQFFPSHHWSNLTAGLLADPSLL